MPRERIHPIVSQPTRMLGSPAALEAEARSLSSRKSPVARAIAFAIEQPDDIDVGDIVVRPTAQA